MPPPRQPEKKMNNPQKILAKIARKSLKIKTLETMNDDAHDFHEIPVWDLEKALRAAFEAGMAFEAKIAAMSPEERVSFMEQQGY